MAVRDIPLTIEFYYNFGTSYTENWQDKAYTQDMALYTKLPKY